MSEVRKGLPRTIEEVTAQWVSEALSIRFPGTVVTDLTIGTIISGTATHFADGRTAGRDRRAGVARVRAHI